MTRSSINRLPDEVRSHIERRLRENQFTLDELITDLRAQFPNKSTPSRSALGRYRQNFDSMVAKMRDQETMSRLLVSELGENPDDRAGALMVQALTTLVNQAVFDAQDKDLGVADIGKLARAAKDAILARSASLKERLAIESAAREKLLAEQKEKLAAMPVAGGVTEETKQAIRAALGIS